MSHRRILQCSVSACVLTLAVGPGFAQTAPLGSPSSTGGAAPPTGTPLPPSTSISPPAPEASATINGEVVVTAQKRQENINNVGMSITAASGQQLLQLGVRDTADLSKVTPGLNFTPSAYGTPIFTIRGVGFQSTGLAASPTVSVYEDEVPLPYSSLTLGTPLDVQRVEVLKGPQGTLFGENATGGAINYVENRPTDHQTAGIDLSYGRFNQLDAQGFVSGPLTDTLDYRVAVRRESMDAWQHSYTSDESVGQQDFWDARGQLQWKPTSKFTARATVNVWQDRSDTQAPQFFGIVPLSPTNGVDPRLLAYPLAPHNDRAADSSACINTSPFDQPFNTIRPPYGYAGRPVTAANCTSLKRDNTFYMGDLRLEYQLPNGMSLTSLTAYERYNRNQPIEGDGTIYQDFESLQRGHVATTYQELRLSGDFARQGNWIIGGNYEYDATFDNFLQTYGDSSAVPSLGVLLGPTRPENEQRISTYAFFANAEYPVLTNVTVHAGIRYTDTDIKYHGCSFDSGDGTWSGESQLIQNLLQFVNGSITPAQYAAGGGTGIDPGAGACSTTGPGPTFHPAAPYFTNDLDQNNVSWRVGADWKAVPGTLFYANISKGYKSGSFPTISTSSYTQLIPARQEGLLAYETGSKSRLFDGVLQLNTAVFYYDYKDKQILGDLQDPVFGALPALVNIPKSDVIGFEVSGVWQPIRGLTVTPGVSYAKSRVIGNYYNYDPFTPTPVNFKGEPFPNAPPWQGDIDVQYRWPIMDGCTAFVGGNVNYQDETRQFFYNRAANAPEPADLLGIPQRTLLDLRAGVEKGPLRLELFGKNVTNVWYWTEAAHVNDALVRYTGMPATYGINLSYRFN